MPSNVQFRPMPDAFLNTLESLENQLKNRDFTNTFVLCVRFVLFLLSPLHKTKKRIQDSGMRFFMNRVQIRRSRYAANGVLERIPTHVTPCRKTYLRFMCGMDSISALRWAR